MGKLVPFRPAAMPGRFSRWKCLDEIVELLLGLDEDDRRASRALWELRESMREMGLTPSVNHAPSGTSSQAATSDSGG